MTTTSLHAEVSQALGRLGLTESASTYHGLLCGALCVQSLQKVDPLRLIEGEMPTARDVAAQAVLTQLRDDTERALAEMASTFMPLLPQDEAALGQRASALADWCEGFLHALATRQALNLEHCSDELREVVKDFTEFTRAALHDGDDLESEEGAYTELVEYIRVGAQLVFMELRNRRQEHAPDGRTLH